MSVRLDTVTVWPHLRAEAPDGVGWLHEIKCERYRMPARILSKRWLPAGWGSLAFSRRAMIDNLVAGSVTRLPGQLAPTLPCHDRFGKLHFHAFLCDDLNPA